MIYDRQIIISAGNSRKDTHWKRQTLTVSELYDRLSTPARGAETLDQYVKLKKSQQDDLKDVGGFVAGALNGNRRKASNVIGRDVITLDFDSIPALGTDTIIDHLNVLGYGYCVYSTRKHAPNSPRLRVLVPTDRTMTPDEYEPCARRVAARIGISAADPTTFEVSRLMYWPSCCADSEYIFKTLDAPLVSVDSLLATYKDWCDINSWPQVPGSFSYQKLAVKQGDPESKMGVVGAFCRTYDVYRAMEELIPGIYDACDEKDRFTYLGGSTTGGAVVYDEGKFLFSHHATDPCSGRLVNAFDLVRLHRFGDSDDEADPNAPVNRLPSYKKMCEFANGIDDVALCLMKERQEKAIEDFKGVINAATNPTPANAETSVDDTGNWMLLLKRSPQTGKVEPTSENVRLILENDPMLKGMFAMNEFAGRGEVLGETPWERLRTSNPDAPVKLRVGRERMWQDSDSDGLYWYLQTMYEISSRGNIDSALSVHSMQHAFNNVTGFLDKLKWDGVPRLDTLFIDYLGAEDSDYTRAVTRKIFAAAVARAMTPGCKFDNMLILCGKQGVGKSTIIDKMSRGFYNDSIRTFEGKEASELIQGVWLVEIAELDAFNKSDVARIKQFLSLRTDRYRAAYGRHVKEAQRTCVFFGTCNQFDFLQDPTGNRRFWPVDVNVIPRKKSVFKDLDAEIEQIWAEAKMRWQLGEELFLSGDLEEEAMHKQEAHREASPQEGMILEFVERKIPSDWSKWTLDNRRDFWAGGITMKPDSYTLVERDRVCAMEIWCELYGKNKSDMKKSDTREINAVLYRMKGWKRPESTLHFGPYGTMRGLVRDG